MSKGMYNQPAVDELYKQNQRLKKSIQIYEELAEEIRTASVVDRSIYSGGEEDPEWLSINREDYTQLLAVLSKLDLWKPWNQTIQPRIPK
ncbi:hypothetical protein [Niallia oryzisoli]|uniref:hypothetical protein n=1 Tax=Niallia oryzisoli TaxID=1737571 RepID=UPI003734DCCC